MDPILCARLQTEDVVQEVYAAAWPKLADGDYPNFAAFLGWLKAIAHNKLIDLRRCFLAERHDVKREVGRPVGQNSSYTTLLDRVASPSSSAARREALAILVTRLARMPEDQRRVLQMRYVQGLSVRDVAERLKRSEPAVHMLCHRALKKLQELMGSRSQYLSRG
jgi:RNA polymerase sigma-70 factor (ECF subfamily)